ncbi:MAG TPA: alpha/beta hydrolase-fold protein [Pyrinomonadaceae bacterium]|nr:alpha/beta hydrolase-fold protein [Pyrinomonadaceae bacterium]
MNRQIVRLAIVVLFQALLCSAAQGETRFDISYDKALGSGPLTGRVILVITKSDRPEPRFQIGPNTMPMFGVDAEGLQPGQAVVVDQTTFGHPVENLSQLPAGEYFVQAMLNVYAKCERSDGRTVWVHWDMQGRFFNASPGNFYSDVQKLRLDPAAGYNVKILLNHVIPPDDPPKETKWIKRIQIKSELLSKFWGYPVYLGATVILPKGYDERSDVRYPVVYPQGYLGSPAYYFNEDPNSAKQQEGLRTSSNVQPGYEFFQEWTSDKFPRFLLVTFVQPSPFFPDGYGVNSANNGPYGDALTQELIPAVEKQFRAIAKPYARLVQGASTGGWGSLGLQLKYPDFFGGAWVFNPDPIDFRRYLLVNIYEDENAFTAPGRSWIPAERPMRRSAEGQVNLTIRQVSNFEAVLGSKGRSGYQLNAWEAIYGPVGPDGYPREVWDKRTGKIDKEVALYMRDNGYDLRYFAEKNWATIGPKLQGKLHFISGDMDNFYLNLAVYLFEDFAKKSTNPKSDATFAYGRPLKGHSWHEKNFADMLRDMAEQVKRNTPTGDSRTWSEY